MVEVICKICNKRFRTKPCFVKKGQGKFCSRYCYYKEKKNDKEFECFTCGNKVYRTLSIVKKSKSQKFFCSKSCQTIWRNKEYVGTKHARWNGGDSTYRKIIEDSGIEQICKNCGTVDKRVFAVHHVDQNHSNNKLENLVWLCHNCHHLIHYGK